MRQQYGELITKIHIRYSMDKMAEIAGDALTRPSRLRESAGRVLLHVVRRS